MSEYIKCVRCGCMQENVGHPNLCWSCAETHVTIGRKCARFYYSFSSVPLWAYMDNMPLPGGKRQ